MLVELLINFAYYIFTVLVLVVTLAIIYARRNYGTLEKIKGVPIVIKPAFVGGSNISVYKQVVHENDLENVRQYGKIFGSYEGSAPHIYIADPDIIHQILVKDFESFHNKRQLDFGHILINEMLDVLPYEKWKVVRSAMSPVQTTEMIKNMSVGTTEAIEDWIATLKTKLDGDDEFFPRRWFTALTTDVIARCGFATKINSLNDPNSRFVKELYKLATDTSDEVNCLLAFAHTFPPMIRLAPYFPKKTLEYFRDVLKAAMAEKRRTNVKGSDYVDILNEMYMKLGSDQYKKLKITEDTIMAQALVFFFTDNFETFAITLTFFLYELSKNPEIQDRIVTEVDAYLARNNGKIEYDTIYQLTYLIACVQEILRLHSPFIRLERVCNKEWYHKPSGLRVPKGQVLQFPITSIHYNPEYHPDPYRFNPERFMPENKDKIKPCTFLPFGDGPHNCIAMKFAEEMIYLAAAHLMKNFTFKPTPETEIRYRKGRTFILSCELFPLKAMRRT